MAAVAISSLLYSADSHNDVLRALLSSTSGVANRSFDLSHKYHDPLFVTVVTS